MQKEDGLPDDRLKDKTRDQISVILAAHGTGLQKLVVAEAGASGLVIHEEPLQVVGALHELQHQWSIVGRGPKRCRGVRVGLGGG